MQVSGDAMAVITSSRLKLALPCVTCISVKLGELCQAAVGPLLASPSPPVGQATQSHDLSLVIGALFFPSSRPRTGAGCLPEVARIPKGITVHPAEGTEGAGSILPAVTNPARGERLIFSQQEEIIS